VRVLRNRIEEVGMRVIGGGTRGIAIGAGELIEVAGNIAHRIGGQAVDVTAGPGPKKKVTPLTRALVHHNKATETLLVIQDFGGIEGWGSGPSYFYNNISAVPVGWIRHNDWFHKNEAYYFDHQFKGYFFNNVGWSIAHAARGKIPRRLRSSNRRAATALRFSTTRLTAFVMPSIG
jgi:hypothetical protein